jgi:hypothetical protein
MAGGRSITTGSSGGRASGPLSSGQGRRIVEAPEDEGAGSSTQTHRSDFISNTFITSDIFHRSYTLEPQLLHKIADGTATMSEKMTFQNAMMVFRHCQVQGRVMQKTYASKPSQLDQQKATRLDQELRLCSDLVLGFRNEIKLCRRYSELLGNAKQAFGPRGMRRDQLRLIKVIATASETRVQRVVYGAQFVFNAEFRRLVLEEYNKYRSLHSVTGYHYADGLRGLFRNYPTTEQFAEFPDDPLVDQVYDEQRGLSVAEGFRQNMAEYDQS